MTKPNDERSATLGSDPCAGAIKNCGAAGGVQLPASVSVAGGRRRARRHRAADGAEGGGDGETRTA